MTSTNNQCQRKMKQYWRCWVDEDDPEEEVVWVRITQAMEGEPEFEGQIAMHHATFPAEHRNPGEYFSWVVYDNPPEGKLYFPVYTEEWQRLVNYRIRLTQMRFQVFWDEGFRWAKEREEQEGMSVTSSAERLSLLRADLVAAKEAVERANEAYLKEFVGILFDEYPQLESFGWRQFAPYFNDGEPCNFGAHTDADSLVINGVDYEEVFEYVRVPVPDALPEWPEYKKFTGEYVPHDEYKDIAPLFTIISDVLSELTDEFLEEQYGDNAEVTVRRDGVTVEEYSDHD